MNNIVAFGEVLLRLSPPNHLRFAQASSFDLHYGGAEFNTSISLALLGLKTSFVTRLPDNDLSKAAVQQLKRYGVASDHICYGGKRLGTYYLEQGAVMRGSKVIYDREHSSIAEIELGMINWEEAFSNADWFHITGITPAVSQAAADETLKAVKIASKMGLTVSIDLNFRSKLWQYGKHPSQVMPQIMQYCTVVLGDRQTVNNYFGIQSDETELKPAYYDVMQKMQQQFPSLQHIIFSYRHVHAATNNTIGACYLKDGNFVDAEEQIMDGMIDRLGGGDALMAGIIYGIKTYPNDARQCIDFAIAASALKSSIPGDTNFISVNEVLDIMNGAVAGKISR